MAKDFAEDENVNYKVLSLIIAYAIISINLLQLKIIWMQSQCFFFDFWENNIYMTQLVDFEYKDQEKLVYTLIQ